LAKQLQDVLGELDRYGDDDPDPVDEIRERRRKRQAAVQSQQRRNGDK
jgi:hypothetical protein